MIKCQDRCYSLSPSFITSSGVKQGCVLAPALFCRAIDWNMERVASRTGFSLVNDHFTDLDYANDVVLLAHKMDDIHSALEVFETTASQLGLNVSWQKTKIQNLGTGTPCLPVCGHSLEKVTEFTYLRSVQSTTGRCQPDIIRRLASLLLPCTL